MSTLDLNVLKDLADKFKQLQIDNYDTLIHHPSFDLNLRSTGIAVIKSEFVTKKIQTKSPRSKRKRIQEKFKKKYTQEVPSTDVYLVNTDLMFKKREK